eukprot:3594740-Pleurochrysis_carterae.AAC.3
MSGVPQQLLHTASNHVTLRYVEILVWTYTTVWMLRAAFSSRFATRRQKGRRGGRSERTQPLPRTIC